MAECGFTQGGRVCGLPQGHEGKHVAKQAHTCHWPGCEREVPPAMWGCRQHWFTLPKALRDRVWRAYRPGQEIDKRPSETYLQVAEDVQAWIAEWNRTAVNESASLPEGK